MAIEKWGAGSNSTPGYVNVGLNALTSMKASHLSLGLFGRSLNDAQRRTIRSFERFKYADIWKRSSILRSQLEKLAAFASVGFLAATLASSINGENGASRLTPAKNQTSQLQLRTSGSETVASGYVGAPYYLRNDLDLKRADGTDVTLKGVGWDGDAFRFPIDGGVRLTQWSGMFGGMVDFMHNKAIARLGHGAHGRKITDGIIEDVETSGLLAGKRAPSPLHLTDLLDRLEFTHGHNVLLVTGLARILPLSSLFRPYVGFGYGVAVPHVEVRFAGERNWTSEYQYAGPAAQALIGLEIRVGGVSYFLEYKFIWSSIAAALTDGQSSSLKDLHSTWLPRWLIEPLSGLSEMPGDLWRQFSRWQHGASTSDGNLVTQLRAHEVVFGAGYIRPDAAVAAP